MRTVLLTGTTGFLGSSLAASLLFRGHRVVSLSRNDREGKRTLTAIAEAAAGFELDLKPSHWTHLRLGDCQYEDLAGELARIELSDVTDVWHCAAHMSYSPKKLDESLRQNLEITTELYELIRKFAPGCERFYHVSTAYTAGVLGGEISERLHPHPRLVNAYQISKWSAEQALANLSREPGALPVTLFRPTIVVGHSRSGWSPGNRFGYFMFVHALATAAMMGVREVTVDLSPEARPNLIPIDEVAQAVVALCERPASELFEVFHCANLHSLTTTTHLRIMGERLGIRVAPGAPRNAFDQKINETVAWNREFASTTFDFDTSRLIAQVGPAFCQTPMTEAQYSKGVDAFLRRAQVAAVAMTQRTEFPEIARIVQ